MDEPTKAAPAQPAGDSDTEQRILDAYKKMLWAQFASTVVVIVLVSVALWTSFSSGKNSPPLLPLIIAAGMLGALFSALTRLYHVDQAGEAVVTKTVRGLGVTIFLYSLTPPVIGALAATVLYLVFAAKLISGDLFPAISCVKTDGCKDILGLMEAYWPTKPEDYCKALVWSFIAGFSERLVPDILQSLATRSSKKDGK